MMMQEKEKIMPDQIDIEILDDGTISMKTGAVSQKNHMSADEFMEAVHEMGGGERKTEARKKPRAFNRKVNEAKHSH